MEMTPEQRAHLEKTKRPCGGLIANPARRPTGPGAAKSADTKFRSLGRCSERAGIDGLPEVRWRGRRLQLPVGPEGEREMKQAQVQSNKQSVSRGVWDYAEVQD